MELFQTKAILGEDGKLRLEVPCRLPPGTVDVVVVMASANPPGKEFRYEDFRGVGKEIWEGVDVQDYINRIRDGREP